MSPLQKYNVGEIGSKMNVYRVYEILVHYRQSELSELYCWCEWVKAIRTELWILERKYII